MDKKIRDAAGSTNHGYDDKNWQKMESLLEKNLPQKKDRRRPLFLLLLLGVIISVSVFLLTRDIPSSGNKKLSQQKTEPATSIPATENSKKVPASPANNNTVNNPSTDKTGTGAIDLPASPLSVHPGIKPAPASDDPVLDIQVSNAAIARKKKPVAVLPPNNAASIAAPVEEKETVQQQVPVVKKQDDPAASSSVPVNKEDKSVQPSIPDSVVTATTVVPTNEQPADSLTPESPAAFNKKNMAKKFSSRISLNFSAGPDLSGVGLKPGKWQMQYGIGVSYALSEKLSVRAGFYAGRKLYSADSSNYHTPYNSSIYSYKLSGIQANCYVYEIPVTLSYHFGLSKNHSWFVSTGLSSYLMKKETYDYTYKNPTGQSLYYTHTYSNKHTHLFSIVNLSGGYQHQMSKRFSLLAEPYLKIPVSGIGFGKVKLNNTGLLFTAAWKPFVK